MFKNLSIKMKLIISFTVIAILVIFSSTTSVLEVSKSSNGFQNYKTVVTNNLLITQTEENILLLNNDIKSFIQNPVELQIKKFDEHYKNILELLKDNESSKEFKSILSKAEKMNSDFYEIVSLMKKIDDIYKQNLSINGKKIVELLSSVMITGEIEEQYYVSVQAGYAIRFMLLARLNTMKFLESNSQDDVKEINKEFNFLLDQIDDMKDEIKSEKRLIKLNEVIKLIPIYKDGVDEIIGITENRNEKVNGINLLSDETTSLIEKIKTNSKKMQQQIGLEVSSLNDGIKTKTIYVSLIVLTLVIVFSITIAKGITTGLNSLNEGISSLLNSNDVSSRVKVISKDEIGKIAKNFNSYLESIENGLIEDQKVIEDVKRVVSLVKEGKVNQKVEVSSQNKNLNELRVLFNDMLSELSSKISDNISKIENALETYSKLDFRYRIENPVAKLEKGLNQLAITINDMLVENKSNGLTIEESSKELLKNIELVSNSSNDAATSIEETASALDEITAIMTSNSQNMIKMAQFTKELTISANDGKKSASKTAASMDRIDVEVNAINEAITVIDQIAFQTNILSLNAAVEAATAGEAGKGFGVVAGEVRNLANRSAQAASEIKKLVESATSKANDGKEVSNEMIEGYEVLTQNVEKTLELINEVENTFEEQKEGIEQINNSINNLDIQTQKNATIANETKEIANMSQSIASVILENANSKEFIGKENVGRRKKAINVNYKGEERRSMERKIKGEEEEDDWESF